MEETDGHLLIVIPRLRSEGRNGGRHISHFFSIYSGSQPPPLRGTSFQGKEGECRFPHRHFERKREIFFVRGQAKNVRGAGNGKHCPPCDWGGRCFMQTVLRRETETGNEKDPSAALGMTKRGNVSSHFFSFRCEPTSAPSGHLLPEEGGSVHASPFPWKGLPSAARRGWLPFLRRSRLLLAFPSREGGPRQRWIGCSR